MRFTSLKAIAATPVFVTLVLGQTYTLCNPMENSMCNQFHPFVTYP